MQQADDLTQIITEWEAKLMQVPDAEWSAKPHIDKWSKKEILGHLIGSALNNLRRFIVTQYQPNDKIVYDQDEWVKLQGYQEANVHEMITTWKALNRQIVRVISKIPFEKLTNRCDTGKNQEVLHTIQYLIDDYMVHLKHHLAQIRKV